MSATPLDRTEQAKRFRQNMDSLRTEFAKLVPLIKALRPDYSVRDGKFVDGSGLLAEVARKAPLQVGRVLLYAMALQALDEGMPLTVIDEREVS